MSRLSIEVTPEQHQKLEAIAALHGQTLEDYILERTLPHLPPIESLSEEEALRRLETFLRPRIAEAERGEVVADSVEQIFARAKLCNGVSWVEGSRLRAALRPAASPEHRWLRQGSRRSDGQPR